MAWYHTTENTLRGVGPVHPIPCAMPVSSRPRPRAPFYGPWLAGSSMIGTVLSERYEIQSLIGSGSTANVYEGYHVAIGRPVAIKVLRSQLREHAWLVASFVQEARLAACLRHPNVVDVLDVGTLEGIPFVVMELLDGETLADRCEREGGLPLSSVRRLMAQLCHALETAHDIGIIHRDLKPSNIVCLPREGDPDFIKLVDFGIAAMQTRLGLDQAIPHGTMAGTPAFMAPEVQRGDWDHRSDIYSAGVLMYQLLTGRVPFNGDTALEILDQHIRADVPRMSSVARRPIKPGLERVVRKALAKNPADRIQSMRELWEEIEMAANGLFDAASTEVGSPRTVRSHAPVSRDSAGSSDATASACPMALRSRAPRNVAGQVVVEYCEDGLAPSRDAPKCVASNSAVRVAAGSGRARRIGRALGVAAAVFAAIGTGVGFSAAFADERPPSDQEQSTQGGEHETEPAVDGARTPSRVPNGLETPP